MVDGNSSWRRLIRTTSCSLKSQIPLNSFIRFRHQKRKTNVLYKSSPRFEPTTFLIHDLENLTLSRDSLQVPKSPDIWRFFISILRTNSSPWVQKSFFFQKLHLYGWLKLFDSYRFLELIALFKYRHFVFINRPIGLCRRIGLCMANFSNDLEFSNIFKLFIQNLKKNLDLQKSALAFPSSWWNFVFSFCAPNKQWEKGSGQDALWQQR